MPNGYLYPWMPSSLYVMLKRLIEYLKPALVALLIEAGVFIGLYVVL
jgi:hypothetical protein